MGHLTTGKSRQGRRSGPAAPRRSGTEAHGLGPFSRFDRPAASRGRPLGCPAGGGAADPLLRRSDRADFQANGILALAKKLKGNPRELAAKVVDALPSGDPVLKEVEVSGPGFLNITVGDRAITETLAARAGGDRLGVPYAQDAGTTVIDYAQPNVAKEMHVGHLRSAVIGDAMVQILEFAGEKVVRRHHIGDWGTQFGMLIQYLIEHPHELDHKADSSDTAASGEEAMSNLNRLYKASRALFDSDEEFKARSRDRVVLLQSGDDETLKLWQRFVDESKIYFYSVFTKLDMVIDDADVVGESGYNDMLDETCRLLEESGVAVRSEGALCVFFDDVKGPDGNPVPLIVRKSNGGYGYAATDLSAIRDRVENLGADTTAVRGGRAAVAALQDGLRDGPQGGLAEGGHEGGPVGVRHGPRQGRKAVQDP